MELLRNLFNKVTIFRQFLRLHRKQNDRIKKVYTSLNPVAMF